MEPYSVVQRPTIAKTKKTLATIEWICVTFFVLLTLSIATVIPKHPLTGVVVTLILLIITFFILLIALAATRGRLSMTENTLKENSNKKLLYLDKLTTASVGRGYAFTTPLILKDSQGTAYSITFSGYQKEGLVPLLKKVMMLWIRLIHTLQETNLVRTSFNVAPSEPKGCYRQLNLFA